MTLLDAWRVLNTLLAIPAVFLLGRELLAVWGVMAERGRLLTLAQCWMLLTLVVAGVANAVFDNPYIGVSMATTSVLWTLYAMLFTPRQFTRGTHHG